MISIEKQIRDFLERTLFLADCQTCLEDDDSFLQTGLVDSMGILHLVTFVKGTYGIVIDDEDLVTDNWDSISRVSDYVRRKLRVKEAGKLGKSDSALLA